VHGGNDPAAKAADSDGLDMLIETLWGQLEILEQVWSVQRARLSSKVRRNAAIFSENFCLAGTVVHFSSSESGVRKWHPVDRRSVKSEKIRADLLLSSQNLDRDVR